MRVLIVAPNWLGDIVMALPAIAGVRRHYAAASLAVAAPVGLAPLLRAVAGIDEIVGLRGRGRGDRDRLRDGRFDLALLLPNSFRSAWRVWRAGVPERWGFRTDARGLLLTRGLPTPPRRASHQVEYYRQLVAGFGMPADATQPTLSASSQLRAGARELLHRHGCPAPDRLIGIAPGAAHGHAKRWPPERFAGLVEQATRRLRATCVLVGSDGDREAGRAIESAVARAPSSDGATPVVNLIGRTDVLELVGVTAWCRAFVSNDTGAMHVAAALGIPVTAIFGATDERATGPLGDHDVLTAQVRCRPCLLRECPIDHRCMTRIPVERAVDAVARRIAEGS